MFGCEMIGLGRWPGRRQTSFERFSPVRTGTIWLQVCRGLTEAAARDMLAGISPLSIAGEIEDALLQFDYDDLNGRAGSHSWDYVEPVGGGGGTTGGSAGAIRQRYETAPGNGT